VVDTTSQVDGQNPSEQKTLLLNSKPKFLPLLALLKDPTNIDPVQILSACENNDFIFLIDRINCGSFHNARSYRYYYFPDPRNLGFSQFLAILTPIPKSSNIPTKQKGNLDKATF